MSKTQPARGMRDFLPSDVRKREYVISIIKEVYQKYGFEPLETPSVENIETLMGKYGEEGNQLIFKILKRGEKLDVNDTQLADLALRYDLTVPLARVVANYKDKLPKFFKRYQIQPVWRADRPARGRFREFYQCDVDAIGSKSMIVEAELISAVCEILEKLGFEDFEVRINHREILRGILNVAGIPEERHSDALIALDKIDKIGREGVSKEFVQRNISIVNGEKILNFFDVFFSDNWKNKFSKNQVRKLLEIINIQNEAIERSEELEKKTFKIKNATVLTEQQAAKIKASLKEDFEVDLEVNVGTSGDAILKSVFTPRELVFIEDIENIENLESLNAILRFLGGNNSDTKNQGWIELMQLIEMLSNLTNHYLKIDPSLARGLSYYTGAIFEIVLTNGDFAGSIGGGGRYDGLIGMFGKEQVPACGFSLGLERILVVMEERGMFQKLIDEGKLKDDSADVMIACFDENLVGESLKLAAELREKDLRVLVYPESSQKAKPMKYAEQIKVPFVCLLKQNENSELRFSLKNMQTGAQELVERETIAEKILS